MIESFVVGGEILFISEQPHEKRRDSNCLIAFIYLYSLIIPSTYLLTNLCMMYPSFCRLGYEVKLNMNSIGVDLQLNYNKLQMLMHWWL